MDNKALLNEVSCSVCMNKLTDPRQLPCLHSFCLHCLDGIRRISVSHDIITCPKCRGKSRVPGNLTELPTDYRINSLLAVLAITNKEHRVLALKYFQDQDQGIKYELKRPAFCQKRFHENSELTYFCENCEVAICRTCVVMDHRNHAFKLLLEDLDLGDSEAANERKSVMDAFL